MATIKTNDPMTAMLYGRDLAALGFTFERKAGTYTGPDDQVEAAKALLPEHLIDSVDVEPQARPEVAPGQPPMRWRFTGMDGNIAWDVESETIPIGAPTRELPSDLRFNRWQKAGKDRLYIELKMSRKNQPWQAAGYIDLATGQVNNAGFGNGGFNIAGLLEQRGWTVADLVERFR